MHESKQVLTAQQALQSMNQMRQMTKILTASTKELETMLDNVGDANEERSTQKKNEIFDDAEDSDFSTSLVQELSDKCIDEDLNTMVERRQERKKKMNSSVGPTTRNAISRADMSMLLFFLFRRCKGEVAAREVLKKHRNTEKYNKKILQLSRSKSIENPVKTISKELRLMVSRAEKFLKEKCKLDLIAEELFRIIYNVLTKYESDLYILRTKHTLIETKKFLSSSRPNWKPSEYFDQILSMYNV